MKLEMERQPSVCCRARFEDLCAAEFIKCTQPIDDVMKTAEIEKSSITYVISHFYY